MDASREQNAPVISDIEQRGWLDYIENSGRINVKGLSG